MLPGMEVSRKGCREESTLLHRAEGFEDVGYGRFRFEREKIAKWNCVFRLRNKLGIAADRYTFRMFVVVGRFDDVKETMVDLTRAHTPRRGPNS